MSPPKFQDGDVSKSMINGPRPSSSSLRITKDSHHIHKTTSSSPPVFENYSSHGLGAKNHGGSLPSAANKRQPVIIYTHSPKVIHAQASDFMALVQKLTGLNKSPSESMMIKDENSDKDHHGIIKSGGCGGLEESESSCSVLTEMKQDSSSSSSTVASSTSPVYKSPPYLMDAPPSQPPPAAMFGGEQLFCSPSRSSNSVFIHQNSTTTSPAVMDYMKGFPEF